MTLFPHRTHQHTTMQNTLFLILMLFGHAAIAQNVSQGWIVNNQGDTVRGVVKEKASMADRVTFRPDDTTDFREFAPADIKAFYYGEGYYYKSVEVPIEAGKPERLFLWCMVEGTLSLYGYQDVFYLEKPSNVFTKLGKKDETKGNYLKEDKKYVGILNYMTSDCPKVKNRVERTKFEAGDLAKTVAAYNDCINPSAQTPSNPKIFRPKIQKGIRAGIVASNVEFPGEQIFYNTLDFKTMTGYTAGIFFNLALTKSTLFVQPELLLTKKGGYYEGPLGTVGAGRVDVVGTYFQVPVSLYYYPFGQKLRPFVSAGGIYGYATRLKASRSESGAEIPLEMGKDEFGFRGGTGISYQWVAQKQLTLEYVYENTLANKFASNKIRFRSHHISLRFSL